MKKNTVKGTFDYLPCEVALRDYLQNTILSVYQKSGFERISTPAIEDAENLDKSEGGENLNLIFKIMKRGQKLSNAIEAGQYDALSDLGLRYDLTLPLSRYYANNKANLMLPMKCIQIDKVYRAERPQKGRLREFVQCDIDILGSDSINCEKELIQTTADALLAIGLKDFTIKINDRRVLRSLLVTAGFEEEQLDSVCITFDKLDKIGLDGVREELNDKEMPATAVNRLTEILAQCPLAIDKVKDLVDTPEIVCQLQDIIDSIEKLSNGQYQIAFDLSLVRGQGYYTGTVFEVQSNEFRGSVGGGGRYDHLIGKFTGEEIPAVGFSIGFERIYTILSEAGYQSPDRKERVAVIYETVDYMNAAKTAAKLREDYDVSLLEKPKKLGKLLNKLEERQFYGYLVQGETEDVKEFKH